MSAENPQIYVLYHGGNCADGYGARFAAELKFRDSAKYFAVNYGEPIPISDNDLEGASVYILDFSYSKEELIRVSEIADLVVVLDHHATAQEALLGLPSLGDTDKKLRVHFDMDKSGAVLAWKFFHPSIELPLLFEYIQDRDLWRWELFLSKAMSSRIARTPKFFSEWELLKAQVANPGAGGLTGLLEQDTAVLSMQNKLVRDNMPRSRVMWHKSSFGNHKVAAINFGPSLSSEMGHALLNEHKEIRYAVCYWNTFDDKWQFSLRSANENYPVHRIAESFGGGGHPMAAGFVEDDLSSLWYIDASTQYSTDDSASPQHPGG